MWQAGATLHRGARASHHRGLSRCGAQAPDAQAQQLRPTGPAALRHVGSSQTRARTHVPCIGRQTPNHCATREAPLFWFFNIYLFIYLHLYLSIIALQWCVSVCFFFLMFREALFIIAKMLKPSRSPSVGEWINKLWYIQTIDYLVLKK